MSKDIWIPAPGHRVWYKGHAPEDRWPEPGTILAISPDGQQALVEYPVSSRGGGFYYKEAWYFVEDLARAESGEGDSGG